MILKIRALFIPLCVLFVTTTCVNPQPASTPYPELLQPSIVIDIPTELQESDIANKVFTCTENYASFKLSNSSGVTNATLVFLKDGKQVIEPYSLTKEKRGVPDAWETTFSLHDMGTYQVMIKISYGLGTKDFDIGLIEVERVQVPVLRDYLVPENVAYNVKTPVSVTLENNYDRCIYTICFNAEGDNPVTKNLETVNGRVYKGEIVVPEGQNIIWTIEAEDPCGNVTKLANGIIKRSYEFVPDITLPMGF